MAYKLPGASGVSLGKRASDRAGMHGSYATQRSGASQTILTDSTGGSTSDATLGAVGATNTGDRSATINANFAKIAVLLNELRAAAVEKGIIKGSA